MVTTCLTRCMLLSLISNSEQAISIQFYCYVTSIATSDVHHDILDLLLQNIGTSNNLNDLLLLLLGINLLLNNNTPQHGSNTNIQNPFLQAISKLLIKPILFLGRIHDIPSMSILPTTLLISGPHTGEAHNITIVPGKDTYFSYTHLIHILISTTKDEDGN